MRPSIRDGIFYLLLATALGCRAEKHPPETPREQFFREHGFPDDTRWISLDVSKSIVTETRRRIHASKDAIAQALLEHGGGEGFAAHPMLYPERTVFIAESLRPDGSRIDTEVLITRREGEPEFLLFDEAGFPSQTFAQPNDPPGGPRPGNVPRVCLGCHMGTGYFDPMMSFPTEPAERKVDLDESYRDLTLIKRFLEGYHRGSHLFSPYGSIWLAKLRSDAREGRLSSVDRVYFERICAKYPDLRERGEGR